MWPLSFFCPCMWLLAYLYSFWLVRQKVDYDSMFIHCMPELPAHIRLCISISWFYYFSLACCPRYTLLVTCSSWLLFTYIGVSTSIITDVFDMFIFRPLRLFHLTVLVAFAVLRAGLPAHTNMSSEKRSLFQISSIVHRPLVLPNYLSKHTLTCSCEKLKGYGISLSYAYLDLDCLARFM